MPNDQASQTPLPVPTGADASCKIGRRAIHIVVDFSLGAVYELDMTQVQSTGVFDCAQTMYVDNSSNASALTIQMGLTLQSIIIPAGAQAYLPVLQPNPPVFKITNGGGAAGSIDLQIMNFFIPPAMWFTTGMPIIDNTLAPLVSNGGLNVNSTPTTLTGPTDDSGTIAVGGTPQVAIAANANRKRFIISNPSTATEILQISFGAGAAGKIDLTPGMTWDESGSSVSGDAIYVTAATAAHAYTAYEW